MDCPRSRSPTVPAYQDALQLKGADLDMRNHQHWPPGVKQYGFGIKSPEPRFALFG